MIDLYIGIVCETLRISIADLTNRKLSNEDIELLAMTITNFYRADVYYKQRCIEIIQEMNLGKSIIFRDNETGKETIIASYGKKPNNNFGMIESISLTRGSDVSLINIDDPKRAFFVRGAGTQYGGEITKKINNEITSCCRTKSDDTKNFMGLDMPPPLKDVKITVSASRPEVNSKFTLKQYKLKEL
jgi:hypothetical protein